MEVNDAVAKAALVEQFELGTDVVGQGALAAAHHDRAEEQMALVDQPLADRLAGELGTADRDVGPPSTPSAAGSASASNSRSIRVLALDTV